MQMPQKIKNRNTIQLIKPTSGNLSEEIKSLIQKDRCRSTFIAGLFTNSQDMKRTIDVHL